MDINLNNNLFYVSGQNPDIYVSKKIGQIHHENVFTLKKDIGNFRGGSCQLKQF